MNILLADDDAAFRQRLARALIARGHEITQAADGAEALEFLADPAIEAAIIDLKMPQQNGLEVLRAILADRPTLRVLIHTGYGSIASAMEAVRLGACDYCIKPTDVEKLLDSIAPQAPLPTAEIDLPTPSLERVEWEHIHRVIADCHGNISEAARVLGLHRRSLQRKLQKYPPTR
jgi:two-component system response regulator RegA